MKKAISLFLVCVILATTIPFGCFADEPEDTEYLDLISDACAAFPEYADRITAAKNKSNNPSTCALTEEAPEIIISETRMLSSKQVVTYTEYSNGDILLADISSTSDFAKSITRNSVTPLLNGNQYNVTLRASYEGEYSNGDYVKIHNVVYRIFDSGYDKITSSGTVEASSSWCSTVGEPIYVPSETASAPAMLKYQLQFNISSIPGTFYAPFLTFTVGNDLITFTVSG